MRFRHPSSSAAPFLALLLASLFPACGGGSGGGQSSTLSGSAAAATVAANSTTIATIAPTATDDSDLAAFGAAVGDRHVVVLTEPTHGDGATYQLKTRLVRYLHEAKGFDVLFIESGMYDVTRIQQRRAAGGDSISVQAPGRIFYMYSRTDAAQQVLKYVDATLATATPLELWGDDVPMDGADSAGSLLPNLQAFLAARQSTLPQSADWPGWLRVAQQSVALQSAPLATADTASFLAMSAQLSDELCGAADPGGDLLQSPAYWCRLVKGVQADYTHLWSATDPRTPTDLRDVTGAGNIEWALGGRLQGRKAILWTHEVHGDNGVARPASCADARSQECGPGWTSVGTELVRAYGDDVYIVNVTAGSGIFDAYNGDTACGAPGAGYTLPAPGADSIESLLATGGSIKFMTYPADAAGRRSIAPLAAFEEEFSVHQPSRFGSGYQGLFYLPTLAPVGTHCAAYPVVDYP